MAFGRASITRPKRPENRQAASGALRPRLPIARVGPRPGVLQALFRSRVVVTRQHGRVDALDGSPDCVGDARLCADSEPIIRGVCERTNLLCRPAQATISGGGRPGLAQVQVPEPDDLLWRPSLGLCRDADRGKNACANAEERRVGHSVTAPIRMVRTHGCTLISTSVFCHGRGTYTSAPCG